MILSPAERSYLYDSLVQSPPIRPDGRKEFQFRPVEATTAFLPSSNGSARIRMADGSECIVSVKSKVVMIAKEPNLIECDIDVSGFRDDSNYVSDLKFSMTDLFIKNFPTSHLHLTTKYAYKLFIDCIVVSHQSHPSTLLTLTAYLALKSTKLPLLISDVDDAEIEEQPTFSDDWDQALLLSKVFKMDHFQPPIFVTIGVVGDNLLMEPSSEEEQVLENGLLVAWYDNKVITPIFNMSLATNSNSTNFKGFNARILPKVVAMCKKYCGAVVKALDTLVEQDEEGAIF
ncbi:CIC11C00000002696 [Sungouiella intermedia]|uniref:Ribosomal RNA-processing protein 42 n=1 Tax=Sungouiella intermedia TaxID=45354 RepID=A0A1L0B8Z6_9ASCO|nr:CIC11C00000002696 [[Candida] intermedia]